MLYNESFVEFIHHTLINANRSLLYMNGAVCVLFVVYLLIHQTFSYIFPRGELDALRAFSVRMTALDYMVMASFASIPS
ncbi:hypothetical protein BDV36DRAFT_108728 [Aspergillus pseudocaelatus]|uniref:Uncharacterized protein n=1 Tax=Aspergillus pseudocaelatus TaxID=1825620 RepID=A0ABQ6W110_9EURO|nr:hypothetical protein BDV36DRAFT_108728 [Aspergillus pseudocaelatus]